MSRQPDGPPAPWLSDAAIERAQAILRSHEQTFGRPLLAGVGPGRCPRQAAQELFAAAVVVLAHDGADPGEDPGPRLIYANRAALRLWRRSWGEMVGMPSRLTAEPSERAGRALALASVQPQRAITDYSGIRVDSRGRRFRIRGARVWSVPDSPGSPDGQDHGGQAAAFSDWWWL
ncbi:MAG: MEKHLA domain-containing protein [Cyanobium sp.]